MKRRTFFKTATGAAALASPAVRRAAAQSAPTRNETLVLVQEYGPNSMDMQGIGAAQPVNGVSLNCYDTLIRFRRVPFADGIMTHDLTNYRNTNMRIRWGFNVGVQGSTPSGSWNIDDVRVMAGSCP